MIQLCFVISIALLVKVSVFFQVILMSGISKNAHEELSSEKCCDDRVPHICNILRFGLLKKDNSLMAIGGPWDTADGGDPSVDDSALVRTAIRSAFFFPCIKSFATIFLSTELSIFALQICKGYNST